MKSCSDTLSVRHTFSRKHRWARLLKERLEELADCPQSASATRQKATGESGRSKPASRPDKLRGLNTAPNACSTEHRSLPSPKDRPDQCASDQAFAIHRSRPVAADRPEFATF